MAESVFFGDTCIRVNNDARVAGYQFGDMELPYLCMPLKEERGPEKL